MDPKALSYELLAAVLEHVDDVITLFDRDGSWAYSSPAGTRQLGYPPGFDPPGGIFALLDPADVPRAQDLFDALIRGDLDPSTRHDLHVVSVTGDVFVYECTGLDLRHDPRVNGFMIVARDVSSSRAVSRELTRASLASAETEFLLLELLRSMDHAVLFLDDRRRVIFANDSYRSLWGYEPGDLFRGSRTTVDSALDGVDRVEVPVSKVLELVADPVGFIASIGEIYRSGVRVVGETVPLADGRILERDYIPVPIGGSNGHLLVYRDVSARVALERSQVQHIRDRALLAEQHRRALLELDELRVEAITGVSHELRTPLSTVIGYAEMLSLIHADDQQTVSYLDALSSSASWMKNLLDELLTAARDGFHPVSSTPELIDPDAIVAEVVATHRSVADLAGVELTASLTGRMFHVDRDDIRKVTANLVSNALKFTSTPGRVDVETFSSPESYMIRVSDTGPGIDEGHIDRVFGLFQRGSARDGFGFGLAAVRSVALRLGGSVNVVPSTTGAVFEVSIPLMRIEHSTDAVAAARPDTN